MEEKRPITSAQFRKQAETLFDCLCQSSEFIRRQEEQAQKDKKNPMKLWGLLSKMILRKYKKADQNSFNKVSGVFLGFMQIAHAYNDLFDVLIDVSGTYAKHENARVRAMAYELAAHTVAVAGGVDKNKDIANAGYVIVRRGLQDSDPATRQIAHRLLLKSSELAGPSL